MRFASPEELRSDVWKCHEMDEEEWTIGVETKASAGSSLEAKSTKKSRKRMPPNFHQKTQDSDF